MPADLRENVMALEGGEPRLLERLLGLGGDEQALAWYPLDAGVLVVVNRINSRTHTLYLIESHILAHGQGGARVPMLGELPAPDTWLAAPAVGGGGFLLAAKGATAVKLYCSPSLRRGGALVEVPMPDQHEVVGHVVDCSGRFVVALRQSGRVSLVRGFGLERWQQGPLLTAALNPTAGIAMGVIEGGGFWLTDGVTILHWHDNPAGAPDTVLTVPDGTLLPDTMRERLNHHRLSHLGARQVGGAKPAAHLYLPTIVESHGVACLPLVPDGRPNLLAKINGRSSFSAIDTATGGLILGDERQIECLLPDGTTAWRIRDIDVRPVPPLRIGDQILTMSGLSGISAANTGREATLSLWKQDTASQGPEVQRHLSGSVKSNFPPLLVGNRVVYATETKEGMRVRMFELPVASETGGLE